MFSPFSNNFLEIFLGWPSIKFLQAMLIGQKRWSPGGGAYMPCGVRKRGRASLAQSVATQLSIQGSWFCLSPMDSVYVEKQPDAWEDCCVENWCEKTRNHMRRWTGRCDMTEKLLKTVLNPNQSSKKKVTLQQFECDTGTFTGCTASLVLIMGDPYILQ